MHDQRLSFTLCPVLIRGNARRCECLCDFNCKSSDNSEYGRKIMSLEGGCQCGAVRYEVNGTPQHVALCHCADCRKSAGAPMVAWAAFATDEFKITKGAAKTFNSSGAAMRSFCPDCGTGLYYVNEEALPGIVDIQSATLDNPDALPASAHIQVAERIGWMENAHTLPSFQRFPGMD
jgi:hypothetical protein